MREAAEETGLAVEPERLLFVIEGAHGESFHRVDLVFLCRCVGEAAGERHADAGQLGCDWLDLDTLEEQPLYPERLLRAIARWHRGEAADVYLGNEEMGGGDEPTSV